MRTLYNGEFNVAYGQLYIDSRVESDNEPPDLDECFMGQQGGLCGAAVAGYLFLMTSTHTGCVPLTIELHQTEPSARAGDWEDIVEVSLRAASDDAQLIEWHGEQYDLDLRPGEYRVRYLCRGMDAAPGEDRREDEPVLDEYLLQFWPAPPQPDRVVRETSVAAADWHHFARELPPPPTAEERAEAERIAREQKEREDREERAREELAEWGGRMPDDRLRNVGGKLDKMVHRDVALVHAINDAGPQVQRAIACWTARRFCDVTGLSGVDWIANGLAELDQGKPLSPPLDDVEQTWNRLYSDPQVRAIIGRSLDRAHKSAKLVMPFPALTDAAHPDPLRAALDALGTFADGSGWREMFAGVREVFPQIAHAPLPPEERLRHPTITAVAVRRRPDETAPPSTPPPR